MNFFEQELRKLFGDGESIQNPKFVGRVCLGELDGDLRVRAEFVSGRISDQYDILRLTVLNRTDGEVDKLLLHFRDVLGRKSVSNPNFRDGITPHIWVDRGMANWYVYRPTAADYQALRQAAGDYLDVFRAEPQRERPPVHKNKAPRSRRGQER